MSTTVTEYTETKAWLQSVTRLKHRRGLMNLLMLLADILGFAVTVALILVLNGLLKFFIFKIEDLKYLVIPLFCLLLFINSKLYPGVGVNPAEEIKLVTKYVTTAFLCGWFVVIWMQTKQITNHFVFPVLWGLSIWSILLLRWCVRILAVKLSLWGEPVVIIGSGAHLNRTITYFIERKRLGYIPVLAAIDSLENQPQTRLVPTIKYSTLLDSNAVGTLNGEIQTALVDVPAISEFLHSDTCKAMFRRFRRVVLISDLGWIDGASMQIQDYEGMIGIVVEKGVLTPTAAFLKRMLDISVALIAGIMLLPAMLVVAIWIKLDSAGPIFYVQERFGKDRRRIMRPGNHWRNVWIYKFRSMFNNADGILETYLRTHPEARSEWERNQKLPNDPRITRAGRLLRKFSIDELPQLLNVLKGEMSLVGPRPLPDYHYCLLSENLKTLRTKLRPGLTGMWQVSGRSDTGTSGMEMWDSYYIYNWSLWLDIYIIMRTVWVVLKKDGAY